MSLSSNFFIFSFNLWFFPPSHSCPYPNYHPDLTLSIKSFRLPFPLLFSSFPPFSFLFPPCLSHILFYPILQLLLSIFPVLLPPVSVLPLLCQPITYPFITLSTNPTIAYSLLSITHLTLIRMAGRLYDSQNFEQKQLKMTWSKTKFPRSIPHKMCQNYILWKVFIPKSCFKWFFNQKVKLSTGVWWCFCVLRLAGSHLWLPSNQKECGRGRGGSHRESSLLFIGRLRIIYDS